jgi:hypothetical protein
MKRVARENKSAKRQKRTAQSEKIFGGAVFIMALEGKGGKNGTVVFVVLNLGWNGQQKKYMLYFSYSMTAMKPCGVGAFCSGAAGLFVFQRSFLHGDI